MREESKSEKSGSANDRELSGQHARSLAALVNQSPIEIYIFDSESLRFRYANHVALANLGYSLEELSAQTPIDVKPEFSPAQFEAMLKTLRSGQKEKLIFETVHQRKDGSRYNVEVHLCRTEYLSRESFLAVILDVTERLEHEGELRLARAALANSGDAIYMVDECGKFLFVNETACSRLGYTREELLKMTVPVIDEDVASIDEYTGRILPRVIAQKSIAMKGTHRRKDGTKFPVEVTVTLADINGPPVLCANVRDVTEKQAAERDLIRGQFFLDNSQDAVYWVKEDSRFVYVNEAASKMLGHSREQLLRMRVVDIDPDYPPDVWKAWWKRMREERYNVVETKHQREDGSFTWVEVAVHFFEHDTEQFIVGVTRDISASKEYEAKLEATLRELAGKEEKLLQINQDLEATNEDLEQFAYVASHDLRTPLRGIANLVSFIREDESEGLAESSVQYLDELNKRVHRMEALLDDMLAYSRAGRRDGQMEVVDTTALLHEIIEAISPPEGICISYDENLPTLRSYRLPLRQVLLNIIGNAVKYHDKDEGTVRVSAIEQGDRFQFTVSDDGPGIDPRYHGQVFEMFKRLHSKDEIDGTGLGLALASKYVRQNGGSIWVDSNIGHGASFHFTWPKQPIRRDSEGSEVSKDFARRG